MMCDCVMFSVDAVLRMIGCVWSSVRVLSLSSVTRTRLLERRFNIIGIMRQADCNEINDLALEGGINNLLCHPHTPKKWAGCA